MQSALRSAAEFVELALQSKPELIIHASDFPAAAGALRDVLAKTDRLFDRGVPVRFVRSVDGGPAAVPLTKNYVVIEAHKVCRPIKVNRNGEHIPVTLPDRIAQMYLDMSGEWNLKPLAGFSMSPLLSDDGCFRSATGYDRETGLWCYAVPNLVVPERPSRSDAEAALHMVRSAFRTFPFSDSERLFDSLAGIEVTDINKKPGQDESAFLIGLMTACCRSSLWLAPGLILTAPSLSGAGSGKGLLVRAICTVAFGIPPRAFTTGSDRHELEKRLAAELVEAQPALFLDNANGVALRSDILASVLTERPARVRLLGQTLMVPLNSTAFIAVTGNGLSVTEDLARRFLSCRLDAKCEDPESRPFKSGFLNEIQARRAELLGAMLTIWRWGRLHHASISRGKPLGSFEGWAEWCRDPLLALGCADPVERIESIKAHDPNRQGIADLFHTWWQHHQDSPMKLKEIDDAVRTVLDPQGRGRQYQQSRIGSLAGTHAAGFVLTRQDAAGKWGVATFALMKKQVNQGEGHRDHRGHRAGQQEASHPMPPMSPMAYGIEHEVTLPPGEEAEI